MNLKTLFSRINRNIEFISRTVWFFLFCFLGFFTLSAQNQITINILIPPPYSPHLTAYLDNPNKVLISFTNTGSADVEFYIHGKFGSADESLLIETFSGNRPGRGLSLGPFETYQASIIDLEDYFSLNSISFTGITEEDLLNDQNVPEGNYQICLQAFDFNSSNPISQLTCSEFSIQFTDPPIILSPISGDSIFSTEPQNVIISWSFPIGAIPGNVEYTIKMVEMYSANRDPYDAMETASEPLFFSASTNINSYLIGPSDPELISGRYYAFVVQAHDINEDILFKNDGKSDVCWFKYVEDQLVITDISVDSILDIKVDGFLSEFEDVIPQTAINGQLLYKLASNVPENASATGSQSGGQEGSGGLSYQGFFNNSKNLGSANNNKLGFSFHQSNQTQNMTFNPPFNNGTINADVYDKGGAEPLTNTTIQLVPRFGLRINDGFYNTRSLQNGFYGGSGLDINGFKFYDIHGNEISYEVILSTVGRVLDVTNTDNSGRYSFSFMSDFITGPIYAVDAAGGDGAFGRGDYKGIISLRIEVLNQKFCSPDVDIFAMPGDALQILPQIALIKDFDMKLRIVSEFDGYRGGEKDNAIRIGYDTKPKIIPGGMPIPNATVKVLRSMQALGNEHPAILLAEGQQLGSTTTNNEGEFKDVFIGKSDKEGRISIPNLVEHWELVDGKNHSPYFFSVSTRADQADSTYEEIAYNYESFFGDMTGLPLSVDAGGSNLLDDDAGWTGTAPMMYNHFYHSPSSADNREVRLQANPPEIKGRLMSQSNLENVEIAEVEVNLFMQDRFERDGWTILFCGDNACLKNVGKYKYEYKKWTNAAGFFRFQALDVTLDENKIIRGPYRRIQIEHPIYKRITWPPLAEPPLNLEYGRVYFKEFQLEPKRILRGKVVDETGAAVKAYVKLLQNNPYVKTKSKWEYDQNGQIYLEAENFQTAIANQNNRIEVLPLSGQYFADTIIINQLPASEWTRVPLVVHRKLHRLSLHVMNKETNVAIANADVVIGDTLAFGKTDGQGNVELNFPSPGEQFLVKVSVNTFSPTQVSYNIPVSSTQTTKTLGLDPSMSITGQITEKVSNEPIDSAMVFARLQSTDGHSVYLETYSGSDGRYTLSNIPIQLTSIEIQVVKEGKNPSYVGVSEVIAVKPFAFPVPSYDFQIKAVNMDLSNIWGFPVVIESLSAKQGKASISGYFYDLPGIPAFQTLNSNEKIYFKGLPIDPNGSAIKPLGNSVPTESYSIPVKIQGGFEGQLHIPSSWIFAKHLAVKKNGEFGSLGGALSIDLASFKFAYDFHGNFYLGSDTTKNEIHVFKSMASGNSAFSLNRYYIFDLNNSNVPIPVRGFKVFGFNASSGFKQAFYQNSAMHIGAILHTDIPMGSGKPSMDLKIHAGEIEITHDNIEIKPKQSSFMSFELENWKVESNTGWFFDKTKDAIVIPKGLIITGLGVDASIKGLNIRPNALREGEIDLQGGLSLGGVVKLELAKNLEPIFNYDAGVGHYRISLVGKNEQGEVAWIDNLPATKDRLAFSSIGMLSDNSSVLSLGTHMLFHNILDIFVDQVMTGNGFFILGGMPELAIPGFVPTMAGMKYTRNAGQLQAKLEPLSGGIDCNGNVVFKLDQSVNAQSLSNNEYTAYGDFFIKPPPGESGDKLTMKGQLIKTSSSCLIEVIPQTINMGKEEMKVFEGDISVSNGTWGSLSFNSYTNSSGLEDKNVMAFTVLGGIKAGCDELSVSKIETPLGDLNMSYIFSEKALVGDLTIKSELNMGFASLDGGQMGMRFDPNGFYLGFAGAITIASQAYLGGFILGDYSADLNGFAQNILQGFETKRPDFSTLSGFYAIGQRNMINESFSLVAIDVGVKAGLGSFVHMDFSDMEFEVGGYGFVTAQGGVDVPACGYVGVNSRTYVDVIGSYKNNVVTISSCSLSETCVGACSLEGCISIFSKMEVSSNSSPQLTLKLGGSCGN